MKGKKFLSCLLTAALCLSVAVSPAAAASFPDVGESGPWAVPFIEDVVAKGIFVGIDDNGVMKFKPKTIISASEVLVTCAFIAVDKETRGDIAADRAEQVKGIITDEKMAWFRPTAAVCLEAGILSYAELQELYLAGALLKPITKERFALYLVRAMQLAPMAKNLPSYTLTFTDKKDITPGLEPYIYVLNMYSILNGNENGAVEPKSGVNRAVAAKMLSAATDVMEENGTSAELSEYTDYDWVGGNIVSATPGDRGVIVLTIASDLSGARTISLPTETPIYQDSMLAKSTQLKPGTYARVNLDSAGAPIEVRLSGAVQTYTGSVVGISENAVMVNVNGVTTTLGYDRFTEVKIGTKTDDRTLIDLEAEYTGATCRVNELGQMVALQLTGGTHKQEGIISGVESIAAGGVNLTVSAFDGQLQRFTVPQGATVTSNGLALANGTLNASYKGSYLSLRVSNDNASNVVTAAIDNATKYLQGAVKAVGAEDGANTVTITDLATNKATIYKVAASAAFAYEDAPITYEGVKKDSFVTIRIAGGELAALWGYPGSSTTEGVAAISYPSGTTQAVLTVTKADGSVASFPFDLLTGSLPEVERSGKTSSLSQIVSGDVVTVTVRYNTVTRIEATPQSPNATGIISEVRQTVDGVTLVVELDGGAGSVTYSVGIDVSVTQGGTKISMYDLRVGQHIAMVTGDGQVSSVDVDKAVSSSNQISGSVVLPASGRERTILFRVNDGSSVSKPPITVLIPSGVTIQDVSGGSVGNISISALKTGDILDVYGSYVENQFKATLVVRK